MCIYLILGLLEQTPANTQKTNLFKEVYIEFTL